MYPVMGEKQMSKRVKVGSKGGIKGCKIFKEIRTLHYISFPCSADHERDWPPCKVVFFGLATNTLNVRNNIFSP